MDDSLNGKKKKTPRFLSFPSIGMDRDNGKIKRTVGVFSNPFVTLPMKHQIYRNLTMEG